MSDWRRAALGVLPLRYHQALLQRVEAVLSKLAPYVGAPGARGGSSGGRFQQLLSHELQTAGLAPSQDDLQQLSDAISKGGAAGVALAIVLATWVADGETWVGDSTGDDQVLVAFAAAAARPMVILQQLWTPCGSPPLSGSDLGRIAWMPPRARASAIMTALGPRRPWP